MRSFLAKLKNLFGFDVPRALTETVVICLLLWATLPVNPYTFYTFLKIVITCMGLYLANRAFEMGRYGWLVVFIVLAIVYNPFVRISLPKEMWQLINIVAALLIARFTSIRLKSAAA